MTVVGSGCSLASFIKEVPVQFATAEPVLSSLSQPAEPLTRVLKLRELQANYICTTVLAKKYRVSICGMVVQVFELFHLCGSSYRLFS